MMEEIYGCKNCENDTFKITASGVFVCTQCSTRHTPYFDFNLSAAFVSSPCQIADDDAEPVESKE